MKKNVKTWMNFRQNVAWKKPDTESIVYTAWFQVCEVQSQTKLTPGEEVRIEPTLSGEAPDQGGAEEASDGAGNVCFELGCHYIGTYAKIHCTVHLTFMYVIAGELCLATCKKNQMKEKSF